MVSPDDLITGALPFVNYSGPTSSVISTGVAPTHTGGVATLPAADGSGVAASAQLGGARAMATATGGTILITWLLIVAVLIAMNVFTFRVQG
jgi:hypothetical protein